MGIFREYVTLRVTAWITSAVLISLVIALFWLEISVALECFVNKMLFRKATRQLESFTKFSSLPNYVQLLIWENFVRVLAPRPKDYGFLYRFGSGPLPPGLQIWSGYRRIAEVNYKLFFEHPDAV